MINKSFTILQKELSTAFKSPLAYLVLIITSGIFNIFFFMILDAGHEASLRDIFRVMEFMFIFILPLLTMKSFADEKSSGTIEFLTTTPTAMFSIVWGKYTGVLALYGIILMLCFPYGIILEVFSTPDSLAMVTGYFGLWLEGAFFIAVGILISSCTCSQTIAAIITYTLIFLLYFSASFIKYTSGELEVLVRYVGVMTHSENFIVGLIKLSDLVYFLSGIGVALWLTKINLNMRWQRKLKVVPLIGLLISALIGVNYFGNLSEVRLDVTKYKQHTLAESTEQLIQGLQNDVNFTVLFVGVPPKYLEDLLAEYERVASGKIKTEIIDPLVDIGYAARFGNIINGQESKLIIQSGEQRRDIDFSNYPLSEELVNNGLLRATRTVRSACFLTGHGEYSLFEQGATGLNKFSRVMVANNIMPQKLLLGVKDRVPEDCDVLVVAGPQKALPENESKFILDYLDQGGDALFLVEHTVVTSPDKPLSVEQQKLNPSLNEILNNWGLNVAYDIVIDMESHASGDIGSPATRNYMPHRAIVKDLDYTFFVRPRSISLTKDRRASIKVAPLILTMSDKNSWGETNRVFDDQIKFDVGIDRAGPLPISFVVWEPRPMRQQFELLKSNASSEDVKKTVVKFQADPAIKATDTRIVVVTDADFISNAFLDFYSNATLGINILNWLTEVDYQAFVDIENVKVSKLNLTSQQKRSLAMILFAIPFVVACVGVIVWATRGRA